MVTHSSILPGESHGQRGLMGYSPWGCTESDTTEHAPYVCQRASQAAQWAENLLAMQEMQESWI